MILSEIFEEFIVLLNKCEVKYLAVGGYAVGFYGAPRYTGDFDIWIKISEENAAKVKKVIDEFGFGFLFEKEDFLKENFIGQMGRPPLRIDVITEIEGVKFDECYEQRIEYNYEDRTIIPFIHYNHLIENKKTVGRHKDLADAEELEKLKKRKKLD